MDNDCIFSSILHCRRRHQDASSACVAWRMKWMEEQQQEEEHQDDDAVMMMTMLDGVVVVVVDDDGHQVA